MKLLLVFPDGFGFSEALFHWLCALIIDKLQETGTYLSCSETHSVFQVHESCI